MRPVKRREMRNVITPVLILLVMVIGGCLSDNGESPEENGETPLIVEPGDVVAINYISWEKETGALVETTMQNANATKETPLDDSYTYMPARVTVGAANPAPGTIRTLPGLEEALLGMEIGEEKIVEVPPEEGYGYPDEDQIKKLERNLEVPRYIEEAMVREIPYSILQQMTKGTIEEGTAVEFFDWWEVDVLKVGTELVTVRHNPVMDKVITTSYGPYTVIEITEEKIRLEFASEEGEKIETTRFKAIVMEIGEEKVFVRLDYRLGEPVKNTLPECEECFTFGKVIEITDEYITVDFNLPLKGKTVIFKVKVADIEKVGR